MATGPFQLVRQLAATVVVGMNEVRFLAFGQDGKFCLVTEGLNGCSGVTIVSQAAAILAHIPPRPSTDVSDPRAGDWNVQAKMNEVAVLFVTMRATLLREKYLGCQCNL